MRLTYEPPTTGKLKNLEKTLCLAGRLLLLKIVKIWNIMEVGFFSVGCAEEKYDKSKKH